MVVGSGDGNIYGVGLTCINRHRGSRHGEKKEGGQPQEFAGQLHFWWVQMVVQSNVLFWFMFGT